MSSEWFDRATAAILARTPPESQASTQAAFDALSPVVSGATDDEAGRMKAAFASGAIGGLVSALPSDVLASVPGLSAIVGDVQSILSGQILDQMLAPLMEKAAQLRQMADTAWKLAVTPANVAASLLSAEEIACKAASATGLPPVTAAWAVAQDLRQVQRISSEAAAKIAKAEDAAWRAMQRAIDELRAQYFEVVGSAADLANDAMDAMESITNGLNAATQVAANLQNAVNLVAHPPN